ncbi:MAG TPA: acetyl-CoA carboxylase, carboxyltransferase subunit beta [Candidatus Baltobacteraceae bacterium]|jgi:acetyl-CoA carboxylase carboxyl transferase subunit beta|nr:acetyl-CoA carboxylase, carboxyltransferase subunit beta [Candidatus Baltobacteraceae bacterium]
MPVGDWLRSRLARDDRERDAELWVKCPSCGELLYRKELEANLLVCVRCGYHFRMHAHDRIAMLVDGDFAELGEEIASTDPLGWTDKRPYPQKLAQDREKTGISEAVVVGTTTIAHRPLALGVMDFHFRGGTMGTVVGERITLLLEEARRRQIPCVIITASGGARMEEGMLALMQMAKTTGAVARLRSEGLPLVTVLTDPTTGGVSASFAFEADVIIAEARAAIGFAGRRVIEQTVRQRLPDNFQTAEFLLEKGHIDVVVTRRELRATVVRVLEYLERRQSAPTFVGVPECSLS